MAPPRANGAKATNGQSKSTSSGPISVTEQPPLALGGPYQSPASRDGAASSSVAPSRSVLASSVGAASLSGPASAGGGPPASFGAGTHVPTGEHTGVGGLQSVFEPHSTQRPE